MQEENNTPQPENAPPQQDQQAPPPAAPQQAPPPASQKKDTTMAMLCHLLGIFTWFIGPLIIWLIKKDEDAYVDAQGKEALNWQITVLLLSIILGITVIGIILIFPLQLVNLIFCIMGTVSTNKGDDFKYPFAIRLIK